METSKTKAASDKPPAGIVGDIHRLKTNGAATVAEIREFLATTRGKSPQEVMGMVAGSNLIWSTLIASAATAVFMFVFTAGPYAVGKMFPAPQVAPPVAAAPAPAKVEEPKTPDAALAEKPKSTKDQAIRAMEMDEAKAADPKKNPLENNKELDSLLDKLD